MKKLVVIGSGIAGLIAAVEGSRTHEVVLVTKSTLSESNTHYAQGGIAAVVADERAAEGQLAPRFNALVRQETCADVAREVGLGEVMKLGRSEMMSGGRRKEALLGDAMEAVIAAVYLDAGFDAARRVVLTLWGTRIARAAEAARDPKSSLQEWAQARGLPPPTYTETGREGPDHQPIFTVEARLTTGEADTGRASGKRSAEQAAARALLKSLCGASCRFWSLV